MDVLVICYLIPVNGLVICYSIPVNVLVICYSIPVNGLVICYSIPVNVLVIRYLISDNVFQAQVHQLSAEREKHSVERQDLHRQAVLVRFKNININDSKSINGVIRLFIVK